MRMKITKQRLKQLITEELASMHDLDETMKEKHVSHHKSPVVEDEDELTPSRSYDMDSLGAEIEELKSMFIAQFGDPRADDDMAAPELDKPEDEELQA
jgi:hypothetical protein